MPISPRFTSAKLLSAVFVFTSPRTYSPVLWQTVSCPPAKSGATPLYAAFSSVIIRARSSMHSRIAPLSVAPATSATTRRRMLPLHSTIAKTGTDRAVLGGGEGERRRRQQAACGGCGCRAHGREGPYRANGGLVHRCRGTTPGRRRGD